MNKILRIFSSFCALMVFTSLISTSVYAVQPSKTECQNSINVVKNRIQLFENRLNE